MIRVKVNVRGLEEMIATARSLGDQFAVETPQLGLKAQEHMRESIKRQKTREGSKNTLENAITVEAQLSPTEVVVGVGSVEKLDREAPYWYLQNYGGMVSPQARIVPGIFGDGDPPMAVFKGPRQGTQEFTHTPQPNTEDVWADFMRVTTPITPMRYIEFATVHLLADIKTLMTKITGIVNRPMRIFGAKLK